MVKKANAMVKFETAMDKNTKSIPTSTTTTAASPPIMALMTTFNEQTETTKKLMQEIASLKNQVHQLQMNMKKQSTNCNGRSTPSLPFKNYKPTNPNEIKLWQGTPYFYCAHCNKGQGCWTKTHSTKGDPSNNVSAHIIRKRQNDTPTAPPKKKQKTFEIPESLQVALANNTESAQLLAAFLASTQADK